MQFPAPQPLHLRVRVPAGSIEVIAEERDTASVDVQPYDSRDASRQLAEQTSVNLDGDILSVITPEGSGGFLSRSGSLLIEARVPLDGRVEIETASADTTCRGRYAAAHISSASGDISLEHVSGDATTRTASGDIEVNRVDGALSVNGASGDVQARRVGGLVDAKLASGDLRIGEAGSDVRVKTASGDVRIGGVSQGTVQVATASGDVAVGVRAGTPVWLDVSTVSGTTRNGLDMGGAGSGDGHHLTLQLSTVSGDVEVRRAG